MLKQFQIPERDVIRVDSNSLRKVVKDIFINCGVPELESEIGSDVLVSTDLRGVDTHGVSNMLRIYVKDYQDGKLNPSSNMKIAKESTSTINIDGDNGLGILQGPTAMEYAIKKAKESGVGIVTLYNSGHIGAVGHHARIAADYKMVGICLTAGGTLVLPTFASESRTGTNPISLAAPSNKYPFFLFDAATSSIAGNKVRLVARNGTKLSAGSIGDKNGNPVMKPMSVDVSEDFIDIPNLLPLGGNRDQGSHKGYGLSLFVEILCTILSGNVPNMVDPNGNLCHFFAAFNIESFTEYNIFIYNMDAMLETLLNTPPTPEADRVIYPGIMEYENEQDRIENGIPLHKEVVEWFSSTSKSMKIDFVKLL
ncbi:MAG TPA: Ldh family oxidoreductase [Dehalococcoidia bacterium]|nr:Ldh family oxidoreductase [Dehalococcoidia bacterium]